MAKYLNNLTPRHTKDTNIHNHFTSLKVGDTNIVQPYALEATGKVRITGDLIVNNIELDNGIEFKDGNEANGYVYTVNDNGSLFLATKFWDTVDNPQLPNGPSDGNIFTSYNVGIGNSTPTELLHVGSTSGDGASIGDITLYKNSSVLSSITHTDLKAEPTSFSLQMNSTGLTQLNAKTDIEFSNNDITNMVLTNAGDLGIGITPTAKAHINGDAIIEGDLEVKGNFTYISSSTIEIGDSLIYLAALNNDDVADIGFYGKHVNGGTTYFSGFLRDASTTDSRYILFTDASVEPNPGLVDGTYNLGILELGSAILDTGITSANAIDIYTNGIDFSNNVQFSSGGDVGIGFTSADSLNAKLDVDGTGKFNGDVGIYTNPVTDYALYINSTDAMRIPVGTSLERPTIGAQGGIRYNTTLGVFEGYDGSSWSSIGGGVIDVDGDTYITPEEGPDDDTLRFYNAGVQSMTLTAGGSLGIGVTNPAVSMVINKTDALAIPSGLTGERPVGVAGYIRYNTTNGNFEGYNGASWDSLNELIDGDRDTYITVEEGADDDTIRFYNAASESMTITATGNVGVGITNPSVSLEVNNTDAIRLPNGLTGERPTGATGHVRYNTSINAFEGYNGTAWKILDGVRDADNDTYIDAEAAADNDELRFYTASGQRAVIDSSGNLGIGTPTPTTALDVNGTATVNDLVVDNSATINGDLTVNGTLTTISTINMDITDPLIKLAKGNGADSVDIGYYGQFVSGGTTKYSGIFRDQTDGKMKLFTDLEVEPTTAVNTAGLGYTKAVLDVGTVETGILKYHTTNLTINNSSNTTRATLTDAGFLGIGISPSYPLHVTAVNGSNWSSRFVNGTSEVFLANDSINGALINSGAGDVNTSYALHVRNADSQNILYVRNDKKVGVLTSTPANVMDIETTTTGEGLKSGIAFIGNQSATVSMMSHNSFAGSTTNFAVSQSNAGETSLNASSGQSLLFKNNGSTIASFNSTNNLILGAPSVTTSKLNVGGSLYIEDDLLIGTNALFVDESAVRTGLGTANPQATLQVSGTEGMKIADVGATNNTELLGFYEGSGVGTQDHYYVKGYFAGTTYPHNITFGSRDTGANIDTLTMTLDGKIGLNTKSPSDLLDVNGNVVIADDLTVNTNTLYVDSVDSRVGIGNVTPTVPLDVTGDARVDGTLTVTGSLIVEGSITESFIVEDPLVKFAHNNAADVVDIGFYGEYDGGSGARFTGFFRDASDGVYKLFEEQTVEPGATVAVGSYALADLNVNDLTASGNVSCVEVITTSDMRVKENIVELEDDDMEAFLNLGVYEYNFKGSDEKTVGIIAQELETVVPEAIQTVSREVDGEMIDDFKTVKQNVLVSKLLQSVKYLNNRVKELESRLN